MTSLKIEAALCHQQTTSNVDATPVPALEVKNVEIGVEGCATPRTSQWPCCRTPADWRNAVCGPNCQGLVAAQPLAEILDLLLECRIHEYIENCGIFRNHIAADDITNTQDKLTDFMLNIVDTGRTKSSFLGGQPDDVRSSFDQLVTQCRLMLQLQISGPSSRRKRIVRCQRYLLNELTCRLSKSAKNKNAADVGFGGSRCPCKLHEQRAAEIWVPSALAAARWFMNHHHEIHLTSKRRSTGLTVINTAAKVMAVLIVYCQAQQFDGLLTAACHRQPSLEVTIPDLVVLQAVLDNVPSGVVDVTVVNRPLALGNRALCLASRARRPDVVAVLLRHGANVTARCEMGMRCDVIEALLVAPCQNEDHMRQRLDADSERCLRLAMAASNHLPIGRLESLVASGYQPRCVDWRRVLVEQTSRAWAVTPSSNLWPVFPPLLQLARCAVRSAVCVAASVACDTAVSSTAMGVSSRIDRLPLPTSLKRHLLLTDSN